jgi:hypothetical protein
LAARDQSIIAVDFRVYPKRTYVLNLASAQGGRIAELDTRHDGFVVVCTQSLQIIAAVDEWYVVSHYLGSQYMEFFAPNQIAAHVLRFGEDAHLIYTCALKLD